MANSDTKLREQLEGIAQKHLGISTLVTRNSDGLDFQNVAVWNVHQALLDAVELGKSLRQDESESSWRRLAMQFDGHRMQALGHLDCMIKDPVLHKEQAEMFLSAAPLSGEKVLAARIEAIVAQRQQTPQPAEQ